MCGIAGVLSFNKELKNDYVKSMCDAIVHRGPDDDGYYKEPRVQLGMRRLSIIDVNGGHQPISNEDKTIWIVFNGEIYNYGKLREDLIKKGHVFKTNTDTEVLVHLYEDYGVGLLDYLNGMFAFALWDKRKEKLFIARDRMGKKPLYYSVKGNSFIFASELKCFKASKFVPFELDYNSLNKYLTYEFVPAPSTIIKDVKKLRPGYYITFDKNRVVEKRYWQLNYSEINEDITENEAKEKITYLLDRAVERRLVSDVPLGVFLSGGIDSSTVAYYAAKQSKKKIKTFNISFEQKSFDESTYARKVASLLQTDHHEQMLSVDKVLELIPDIADFLDEPFGDASIIPTYLLSKYTKQFVTVALGGDGGDELFAGYPTYQAHKFYNYYNLIPRLFKEKIIPSLANKIPVSDENVAYDFKIKKFLGGVGFEPHIRNYIWLGSFNPEEKKELFSKESLSLVNGNRCFEELEGYWNENELDNLMQKILYVDAKMYLQDDILVKVDRASMFASLEVRAPFLDKELVEFVQTLPFHLKMKGFKTKNILKKSLKGMLPSDIINRPKKGFGIPLAKWIKKDLSGLCQDIFSKQKIEEQGIFNYNYIQQLLKNHNEEKQDNRKPIWTLLAFQLWYEKNIGS